MANKEQVKEQIEYLNDELSHFDSLLQAQMKDRDSTKLLISDLDSLSSLKQNDDMIVPISKGIFVKLNLKEFRGFLVNVGSNVLVDKDLDGVKKILNENLLVIEENIKSIKSQEDKIVSMIEALNKKLHE